MGDRVGIGVSNTFTTENSRRDTTCELIVHDVQLHELQERVSEYFNRAGGLPQVLRVLMCSHDASLPRRDDAAVSPADIALRGQDAERGRPALHAAVRGRPPTPSAHILPTSTPEALPPVREKGPLTCCLTRSGGRI